MKTIGIVFFVLAWLAPLAALFFRAAFTWNYDETVHSSLIFTLKLGFSVVGSSLFMGSALATGAYLGLKPQHRRILKKLWIFPVLAPTLAVSAVFLKLFGTSSFVSIAYSFIGIATALSWIASFWVALLLLETFERLSESQLASARTLGLKNLSALWTVGRRAIFFSWAQSALTVFAVCLTSFTLVLVLGGGAPQETLETSILMSVQSGLGQFDRAATCGMIQLGFAFVVSGFLVGFSRYQIKRSQGLKRNEMSFFTSRAKNRGALGVRILGVSILGVSILGVSPLLLAMNPVSLKVLGDTDVRESLWLSLQLAIGATFLGLLIALGWLKTLRFSGILISMIQCLSIVVVGLGLYFLYGSVGSGAVIVLMTLSILPFFYRWLSVIEKNRDPLVDESARMLGVRGWMRLKLIDWPLYRRTFGLLTVMGIALCISELSAVSLFISSGPPLLASLVREMLGQYRFAEAQGIIALMLWLTFIAVTGSRESAKGIHESST